MSITFKLFKWAKRHYGLMVILSVMCLMHWAQDPLFELFFLDKQRVMSNGEWWRVITGFLVHSNAYHLAFNVLGLLIMFSVWSDVFSQPAWLLLTLLSALFVALMYILLPPENIIYFGFSAILYSQITASTLMSWPRYRVLNSTVLVLLVYQIATQMLTPDSMKQMVSLIQAPVAASSHLYGALFGILWWIYWSLFSHQLATIPCDQVKP